jgi:hypothetical protein
VPPILSRCGYRCDLCLAYKPNIARDPSCVNTLSDGWFKYYGFRIQPAEIYCDGCTAENPRLIDTECPVRPCVIEKNLDTCAACDAYICAKLTERLVVLEEIQVRVDREIPEEDYQNFIRPYENKRRLKALRSRLITGSG